MSKKKQKMYDVHGKRKEISPLKGETEAVEKHDKGEKRFGVVMRSEIEKQISDEVEKLRYLKATRSEVLEIMLEMFFERFSDRDNLTEELEQRVIAKRKGV